MSIVIGLGPGRAGTASLAQFLNQQPGAFVTHECNPACMAVEGTTAPVVTMMREFRAIQSGSPPSDLTVDLSRPAIRPYLEGLDHPIQTVGDVAFYHLNYVRLIMKLEPNARFLCMRRNPEDVVQSFLQKTAVARTTRDVIADRIASLISGRPYHRARNHWVEHDGAVWLKDPVWDKLFPKFDIDDRKTAIRHYVDWYYDRAQQLADDIPNFSMIPIDMLNHVEGQRHILEMAGLRDGVFRTIHANARDVA